MKRKYILLLMLPVVLVMFALQSCNKKDNGYYKVYHAFTQATPVAPVDGALLHLPIGTTTVDLSWASTNADGDSPVDNVYFGTTATPPLYKTRNTGLTLAAVPVDLGQTYYWSVTMIDVHGVYTYAPVWSFTVYDPVSIFIGSYTVDEPAEGWTYKVNLSKISETALGIDLYWASWPATFTIDLTANTYSLPRTNFGGGYEGQESGTMDPATGTLKGTYTIWYKGAIAEQGPHTYTKN